MLQPHVTKFERSRRGPPEDQPPPHNLEAEQAVLGALLLGGGGDAESEPILEALRPEAFYNSAHRAIFGAIETLAGAGRPFDLVSVTDCLRVEGRLDEAGGAVYVTGLLDAVPGTASLGYHVEILLRDMRKRQLGDLGMHLQQGAGNGQDPEVLAEFAGRVLDEVRTEIPLPSGSIERVRGGIKSAAALLEETAAEQGQAWFSLMGQEGLLGPGLLVVESGHAKVGKSTKMRAEIRGLLRDRPGLQIVVLTEDPPTLWRQYLTRWGLAIPNLRLWFADGTAWPTILTRLEPEPMDVLYIDSLRSFLGVADWNDASKVTEAILPLVFFTRRKNVATLAKHHLRKSEGEEGLAASGSTALIAQADIVLELRRDKHSDTRRVLTALSRFDETPRALTLERRGEEIVVLGSPQGVALEEVTGRVLSVLPDMGEQALTREQIHQALEDPRPSLEQLSRALRLLVERHRAGVNGEGKKGSPYRWYQTGKFHSPTISPNSCGIESEGASGHD